VWLGPSLPFHHKEIILADHDYEASNIFFLILMVKLVSRKFSGQPNFLLELIFGPDFSL